MGRPAAQLSTFFREFRRRLLEFENTKQNREILAEIIFNEYTTAKLIDSFSPEQDFDKERFRSLLFILDF